MCLMPPQDAFYEQLDEAKACVEEPPQPKIKLRGPSTQTPAPGSAKPKRITIHVGGGREDSQGSPVPQAGPSSASAAHDIVNGAAARTIPVNASLANLPVQSPGVMATPVAAVKREDSARQSPAIPPQTANGYSASAFRPVMPPVNGYGQPPHLGTPNGHISVAQPPQKPLYDVKYRGQGTSKLTMSRKRDMSAFG